MNGALTRYRVMAYVTGTALLVLVIVAMPLKYGFHDERLISVVGPLHGFLYMVYLVVAFELAYRNRWSIGQTVVLLLAGTVPFLTFIVERRVTHRIREEATASAAERT